MPGRIKNRGTPDDLKKCRFGSERYFTDWVISVLKVNGWLVTHMHNSQKQHWNTHAGIPDITAAHPTERRLLFAELKMPSNKPTEKQQQWLDALRGVGEVTTRPPLGMHVPEVHLWYPKDEAEIIKAAGGRIPF